MAKAKSSASAPESEAAKPCETDAASSAAAAREGASATPASESESESKPQPDLRPNDIDILSEVIRIVCTPKLKRDLISLRERVAEFLDLPVTYPNHRK